MSVAYAAYNPLDPNSRADIEADEPRRMRNRADGALYLDLRGLWLEPLPDIDEARIAELSRIVRGLIFAAVEGAQSGHPGGSSSKTEQLVTLLASGALAFDAWRPKQAGRDRVVWSAGHCSPLAHALGAVIYESLSRKGATLSGADAEAAVYPEDLARFRKLGGPSGHVESTYALADTSTGSSGHGLSGGAGLRAAAPLLGSADDGVRHHGRRRNRGGHELRGAQRRGAARIAQPDRHPRLQHLSASTGRSSKRCRRPIWTIGWRPAGTSSRSTAAPSASSPTPIDWRPRGLSAPSGRRSSSATPPRASATGRWRAKPNSHGTPLAHENYVAAMHALGFDIPGVKDDVVADIKAVVKSLSRADSDYLVERLAIAAAKIAPEPALEARMATALKGRPLQDYRALRRPAELPAELVFAEGAMVPTRRATEAWFAWAMRQTAFFYVGAGDLAKSTLTTKAEQVYGLIGPENPLGRGLRFGIAEQNMAMMSCAMSQDTLPGGHRPMTAFATYGVFTCMMANPVRMTLINSAVNPGAKAFFIMLAAHDGPETGEDGPTHHGLFWMSLFTAYPGIKVFKPLDANEAIEMLFYAAERGEPVAFSVVRPGVPVLKRGDGTPPAREAINGAYVFKSYRGNGKAKRVLAISGGQVMANALEILPELEESFDVKIIAVTSPQLFEEFRQKDPARAEAVLSAEDRAHIIALHNGWRGFLYPFLLPADYVERSVSMDAFMRSGSPKEIYHAAGFDPVGLREKFRNMAC